MTLRRSRLRAVRTILPRFTLGADAVALDYSDVVVSVQTECIAGGSRGHQNSDARSIDRVLSDGIAVADPPAKIGRGVVQPDSRVSTTHDGVILHQVAIATNENAIIVDRTDERIVDDLKTAS